MIKKAILTVILLNIHFLSFSQTSDFTPVNDYKILKQKFFPRDENSREERELIEYIKQFCDYNRLDYRIGKIDNQQDIITNSYNIEVTLKGNGKGRLIALCPLDSEIINQECYDNSITLQIVLDLILQCNSHAFDKDITFLFSGANNADKKNYYGAKYFMENSEDLSRSIVTIIDLLDFKTSIRFTGSINGRAIPSVILKDFLDTNYNNYGIYFDRNEIYRTRFNIKSEDNMASLFLKNKINAVMFYNKDENYDKDIYFNINTQKKLNAFFFSWLVKLDSISMPIDMDYHYIYFNFFGLEIFIPEFIQITIYILIIFLTIMSRLLIPVFKKYHFRLLLQNLPYFLTLLLFYFILSFLPLLVFMPISALTGIYKAYLNVTAIYFLNIFFVPLFIIYILYNYIKSIFRINHSYIYVYGAFVFCLADFLLFFLVDISIAMTYLWASLILTLTGFIKKSYRLKYILYSLSSVGLIILLFDLTFTDNSAMLKTLNPVLMNFIFSLMTFPFILLFLRALVIYLNKTRAKIKKRNLALIIAGVTLTSLIVLISASIFTEQKKDILYATLVSGHDKNLSTLSLESTLPIGELYMESGTKSGDVYITKRKKEFVIYTRKTPYIIDYETKIDNSYFFNFNINSSETIEYLVIYLVLPKDSMPVNSNFVFNKIDNPDFIKFNPQTEDVYFFNPGRNPGDKITFELELSNLISGEIYFIPEYPRIDPSMVLIKKPDKLIEYKSVFIESYDLNKIASAQN